MRCNVSRVEDLSVGSSAERERRISGRSCKSQSFKRNRMGLRLGRIAYSKATANRWCVAEPNGLRDVFQQMSEGEEVH